MNQAKNPILPGDVFPLSGGGSCVVIEYRGYDQILIEHQDRYRHRDTVESNQLRSGKVKNPYQKTTFGVGFFGCGPNRASANGKMTPAYKTWRNMMRRSYCSEFQAETPTYDGCSVADEWHDFQNFAEWYYAQPNNSIPGFDLDKDLTIVGNKVYSRKSCSILPKDINTLLMDCGSRRGSLPQGVSFSKEKGLYLAQVKIDGATKYLGRFADPASAREAYVKSKTHNIRRVAAKYQPVLPPQVYENLMSWTLQ